MKTIPDPSAEEKRQRRLAYYREYRRLNKEWMDAQSLQWRAKHRDIVRIKAWFRRRWNRLCRPEKVRKDMYRRHLKKHYGITPEEYERILETQGNVCAICHKPEWRKNRTRVFCVDHCHKIGKVRGLLCHGCNTALGNVRDDPAVLASMIEYLAKHSA